MLALVVDARESGLGRLLAVETDVLDRGLDGPEAMLESTEGPSALGL